MKNVCLSKRRDKYFNFLMAYRGYFVAHRRYDPDKTVVLSTNSPGITGRLMLLVYAAPD